MSVLRLELIGHLGRDASVKDVNGMCAINFSVACTEKYTKDSVVHEKTIWIECTVWRKPEHCKVVEYLKKGTMVYLDGKPDSKGYKSKNSEEIHGTLILRVDKLQLLGKSAGNNSNAISADENAAVVNSTVSVEDDLPF